ncbi:MAG TPA: hypothetical protein VNU92_03695 [Edaphobacter sp.]|jgi:hypothetical protein|nr:hypothetical protein [Edaphobacter sp.]
MLRIATIGMLLMIAGSASITDAQMNVLSHNDTVLQMEQKKMRQFEQQKQLKADTDKLVALTAALKEQVDTANKDVLSVDMLKKAEQIEKLARSVKERIKE